MKLDIDGYTARLDYGSFLNRCASLTDDADTVVIFPAGRIEVFGDDDIVMDAAAAQIVIDGFNERGVKIPVDYEHSTLYKAGQGEASPAAGWVVAMSWDADRGLVGTVQWGKEARRQIKAGEYKYLSPHFRIDRETGRVDHVLAVALTNTPKINNMRELVAASVVAVIAQASDGDNTMLKKHRLKLCSVLELKDEATDEEIIAQVEEAVEAPAEAPTEVPPEDQAVIAVKGLLLEIQRALMEANVIGAESSLADAMQAALDLIGTSSEDTAEAAASIASALGMSAGKKHTTEEIVATINDRTAKSVPVKDVKALQEKVASLEGERSDRKATEIIGSLVESGKLNPHDEKNMAWARNLAKTEPDTLTSLMEDAPALYKSGQLTPNADAIKTKRDTVIASAVKEFENDASGCGLKSYVNVALDEDGLEHLNDDESKRHAIK